MFMSSGGWSSLNSFFIKFSVLKKKEKIYTYIEKQSSTLKERTNLPMTSEYFQMAEILPESQWTLN